METAILFTVKLSSFFKYTTGFDMSALRIQSIKINLHLVESQHCSSENSAVQRLDEWLEVYL
jgi:hypothetical protein